MLISALFTIAALILSLVFSRSKTIAGLKKALMMFLNILPAFLTILIIVSILLFLTPEEMLVKWLGKESGASGMIIAAFIGSISLIPGFIAYPLCAILIKNGVGYSIIAVFISTLMMVGVVTLSLESKYFGWRAATIRNLLSLIGAIIIGLVMGLLWDIF